jgi:hypothetical protein
LLKNLQKKQIPSDKAGTFGRFARDDNYWGFQPLCSLRSPGQAGVTITGVFRRFAPFDAQGERDDNYGFLGQPIGEPMERSDLTIVRSRSGVRWEPSGQKIAAYKGGGRR